MTSTMLRSTSRGVLAAAAAAVAVVLFFLAPATGATPRDRLASAIYMADLDHVRRLMDQWHEGIEMIAQSPIDIGRRDELGRISLMMCGTDPQEDHVATDKACGEIGRLLIKAGADVDAIDEKEWSVVAYAASLGWSTLVQRWQLWRLRRLWRRRSRRRWRTPTEPPAHSQVSSRRFITCFRSHSMKWNIPPPPHKQPRCLSRRA